MVVLPQLPLGTSDPLAVSKLLPFSERHSHKHTFLELGSQLLIGV